MHDSNETVQEESKNHRQVYIDVPGWFDALSLSVLKSDKAKTFSKSVLLSSSGNSSPDASESVKILSFRRAMLRNVNAIFETTSARHQTTVALEKRNVKMKSIK